MKNIWKKLLATVLCLSLIAALAVCGVAEEAPIEISIAVWGADQAFSGSDEILEKIESELNIKIVSQNVTWDDYTQKVQLWASSDSLPDVFIGDIRTTGTYSQWADQGVIHAIPEDLSAYPTLEAYLQGQAALDAQIDGVLYCLPRQTYPSQEWTTADRFIVYRWDLAQKAGITKEPETWDEFAEMIEAIIAADPDGAGVGGMTTTDKGLLVGMFMPYASSIDVMVADGLGFKWVDDNGTYKPAYFVKDTKAAFQLARDLYTAGVIESDIALANNNAANDKFLQGKSAAILVAGTVGATYETIGRYWEEVHGTEYLDDIRVIGAMPNVDGELAYPMWGYAWSESYISAKVSDEKLDKILKLWDYLLTDEGGFLTTYGPEGELYDMVDGKVVLKDDTVIPADVYPSITALGILTRWNPSTYDDRYVSVWPAAYTEVTLAQVEKVKDVPIPEYNQDCTNVLMTMDTDFSLKMNDDFMVVMTGDEPVDAMWDQLVKDYEYDGLNEVIEAVNAALK